MTSRAQLPTDFKLESGNMEFCVTDEMVQSFHENGYVIVRSLLNAAETEKLTTSMEKYKGLTENQFKQDDGKGGLARICLWNYLGEDVTAMIASCDKVAGSIKKFLGGEVYHYHSKLIMKDARTGGQFAWHQDYGYWYKMGCIFPSMGSVVLAVDEATKDNGCLQILRGSHKLGRLDHVQVGGQAGADIERVEHAKKFGDLVYLELKPGDACFFHCNLLHTSAQNHSDKRRWAFIIAYNRTFNNPVAEKNSHAQYTPLHKVPNSAIMECKDFTDLTGKKLLPPER